MHYKTLADQIQLFLRNIEVKELKSENFFPSFGSLFPRVPTELLLLLLSEGESFMGGQVFDKLKVFDNAPNIFSFSLNPFFKRTSESNFGL